MNKLVEEAKALNIPRRNLMKKDQLKQAIKDAVDRYKETFLEVMLFAKTV